MKIEILPEARDDMLAGYQFYEQQERGLGNYFRDSLNSLAVYDGIHAKVFGYHRSLSKRFPFENVVRVRAVLDCRRKPSSIRRRLREE